MRWVPEDIDGKLTFYAVHLQAWAEAAGEIGLDEADVAELATLTALAKEASAAQYAAQESPDRDGGPRQRDRSNGSQRVRDDPDDPRAHATQTDDNVYLKALLPMPATPAAVDAPGQPTEIAADLQQVGWLTLSWRCKNPRNAVGTMYHVARRLNGAGSFAFLAAVGKKKYTDETIPQGTRLVEYEIQAIRSTRKGPVARHAVNFGTDGTFRPTFIPTGQAA